GQVPDLVDTALVVIPVPEIVALGHAALSVDRAGSSPGRGLPSTRRDIHDASQRGTSRAAQHDSLFMRHVMTLRLPRSMASTAIRATSSAVIIERFAIQL